MHLVNLKYAITVKVVAISNLQSFTQILYKLENPCMDTSVMHQRLS